MDVAASNPALAEGLAELQGLYAALGIRRDLLEAAARAAVADDFGSSKGAASMPGQGQSTLRVIPTAPSSLGTSSYDRPLGASSMEPSCGSSAPSLPLLSGPSLPAPGAGSAGAGKGAPASASVWAAAGVPSSTATTGYQGPIRRQSSAPPEPPSRPVLGSSAPAASLHASSHALAPRHAPGHAAAHAGAATQHAETVSGRGSSAPSPPRLGAASDRSHAALGTSRAAYSAPVLHTGGEREGQGGGASSVVAHITLSDLQSPPPKQAGLGSRQPSEAGAPSLEQSSLALAHAAAMAAAAATGAALPASLADLPIPPALPVPAELQQLLDLAASLPVSRGPAHAVGPSLGLGPAEKAAQQQRQQDAQRASAASRASPERRTVSPRAKDESLGMSLLKQATQQGAAQAQAAAPRTPGPSQRKPMAPVSLDVTILPAPLSKSHVGSSKAGSGKGGTALTPAQLFDREQRRVMLTAEISVSHTDGSSTAPQDSVSALDRSSSSPGGGAKRVGSIDVRRGDTGIEAAYSLAHKFVMKHQLAGLGPEHVIRIAKAIHRALDAALQAEAKVEEEEKKRANSEVVEAYRGKTTTVQPFSLQTMELAETRSKAASQAGTAAGPEAAAGASAPPSDPMSTGPGSHGSIQAAMHKYGKGQQGVDVNARRGALLAKLHVEVAPGKTGVISIRAEDDPRSLVTSFGKAYGIRDGPVLEGVLQALLDKVAATKAGKAAVAVKPLPPPPAAPWPLPVASSATGNSYLNIDGAASFAPAPTVPPAPAPAVPGPGPAAAAPALAPPATLADGRLTLLPSAPNRSSYVEGPFGEKLPSPTKPAHPAGRLHAHEAHVQGTGQPGTSTGTHINMWFEDSEKEARAGVRRVSVASAGNGRPSFSSSHVAPAAAVPQRTPGQTLARSQALAASALAQPSKRTVARGRSAYAKAGQSTGMGVGAATTVIVVPAPTPRAGEAGEWGETLPRARVRSAAGETRRSASAARRAEALYEVLSPNSQRAAGGGGMPLAVSTSSSLPAAPSVRISFGTRSASASRASSVDKGRPWDAGKAVGVTVSAQSVASQSRRASRASSVGLGGGVGGTGTGAGRQHVGVTYSTPAGTPTRAQNKGRQSKGAGDVIVIRPRPSSRSGQLSSSSEDRPAHAHAHAASLDSTSPSSPPPWAMTHNRYEGIVPSPKLVPGPIQAQVTAASMREGLRQDALERVLAGKASLGALPLPLTMGAPHTYTPVTTPKGATAALHGRSPAFSPELAGESLIAGRTPVHSKRHATDEEEEEEEEEGYTRPAQLTAAQKRLLEATLTPAQAMRAVEQSPPPPAGVKTAAQLQAGLDYTLPPPPPPPPASSRRHRSASHGSSGSQQQAESVRLGESEQGKPLFNLDVDIGGGRKGRIVVREGCVVETLAEEFLATHSLPPAVLPKLQGLILGAIQAQRRKAEREVELLGLQHGA